MLFSHVYEILVCIWNVKGIWNIHIYNNRIDDAILILWKKCYTDPEEEDVNKNLINHVRGRSELSFYSLYKNIKYEEAIKEYTAKICRKQVL